MPIWWATFIYMLTVGTIGMIMYKYREGYALAKVTGDKSFNSDRSIGIVFALASFILLAFFVGERSFMFDSFDYQYAYTNYYNTELSQIPDVWAGKMEGKGKLYMTLLVLFKHFSGGADYNAWFLFLATLQCIGIAVFLSRYSVNYALSIYLFYTSSCFLWLVNGTRQFLAVALILAFSNFIMERKLIPFLIVILFAYNIHSSAILMIPAYFIVEFKPWSKKAILLSVAFMGALFLLSTSSFLDDTDYSYVASAEQAVGVNPLRVLFMTIPMLLALWKRKDIEEVATPYANIWINFSLLASECYIVGMFTSGVMGRLPVYFQMFNYLLLPWMFRNAFKKPDKGIIAMVLLALYFGYFIYDMYMAGNGLYHSTALEIYFDEI